MKKLNEILKTKSKLIIIVLFILFSFKFMQSCSRASKIDKITTKYEKQLTQKDSIINSKDSIITVYKIKSESFESNKNDLLKQAQIIKSNTTVTIKDKRRQ